MQCLDGGETQDIQRAPDFITGFADAEAGFSGDESREFLASRLQEQSRLVEDLVASEAFERFGGCESRRDGGVHVFPTCQFNRANGFALPWGVDCELPARADWRASDKTMSRRAHG
jgi:hypothetical protein